MAGRLIARGILLLISGYLAWHGIARITGGGDGPIFGWPLLALGAVGGITAAASWFFGRRGRRLLAMCVCLASSVPFALLAESVHSRPDHGELAGLVIIPYAGAAVLLVVAAALFGLLGWLATPDD